MLEPASARSEGAAALETLPDGSLRASGANPDGDTYTVVARTGLAEIRAIPARGPPRPVLARRGNRPGARRDGSCSRGSAPEVASDARRKPRSAGSSGSSFPARRRSSRWPRSRSSAKARTSPWGERPSSRAPTTPAPPRGRSTARPTAATRSPTRPRTPGPRTTRGGRSALAEPAAIERIIVWNRTDKGVEDRLSQFRVQVLDDDRKVVWQTEVAEPPETAAWSCSTAGPRPLAFARVRADFAQTGFDIAGIIDPKASDAAKSGWAVSAPVRRSDTRPSSC